MQPEPADGMGDAEYVDYMDLVTSAVRLLRLAPLVELRFLVERIETLAPILEPTAYMRGGGDNLRDQREILEAAAHLVEVAERVEARAGVRR